MAVIHSKKKARRAVQLTLLVTPGELCSLPHLRRLI